MSTPNIALLIGASGGIAQALITELLAHPDIDYVHAISRTVIENNHPSVTSYALNSLDETAVAEFVQQQKFAATQYRFVISTVGILHRESSATCCSLKPEKRLEDVDPVQLQAYFEVNSVIPAIWLKHLVKIMPKGSASAIAFLSARVGSISDNKLGGWYGYRASKSALNMFIKNAAIEYGRRNKHVALLSYHPGTVDTGLSKPFQANVKPEKLFTPEFTAQCLVKLLTEAKAEESPYYLDWAGKTIPW